MAEWFEDEAFWITMYPYMFPSERFTLAEEQVEKILTLLEFQGTEVLDLCCGPGRHAVLLAKRGLQVTGVDRTPFLLEKAKERGRREQAKIEWVLADMRDFIRPQAYDLVLNMFTSFGYFDDKDDDLAVLQNIYQSLKPNGICLIDVMGKERLARVFQAASAIDMPDGSLLVQRHEVFDAWSRIRNEWILIKDGQAHSFKFHHTLYSGQELKDRLAQAGFEKVQLYGDLDGNPYDIEARRLVAVARKGA